MLVIFHSLKSGLQMTSFACYEVFSPELYPHTASLPVEPTIAIKWPATYYLIKSFFFFQCYWHFVLLELFQNHLLQVSNWVLWLLLSTSSKASWGLAGWTTYYPLDPGCVGDIPPPVTGMSCSLLPPHAPLAKPVSYVFSSYSVTLLPKLLIYSTGI